MEDLTILISVGMIGIFVLLAFYRGTQNPKAKQKDTHYSTLIKIKDETIVDAVKTIKKLRSKIWRLEEGGTIEEGGEDGDDLGDLIDLYDNAPGWIKAIVSKDEAKKILEGSDDKKIKGLVDKFKKGNTDKEGDLSKAGL